MTEEQKQEVEVIFAEIAKKTMKSFGLIGFKNTFHTLYNKVIIPTVIKYSQKKDEEIERLKQQLNEKQAYINELKRKLN